jgi:hypothetical protein
MIRIGQGRWPVRERAADLKGEVCATRFSPDNEPTVNSNHELTVATCPQDWRWSSYNNFALDKARVAACRIQIDYVRLPEGYRA